MKKACILIIVIASLFTKQFAQPAIQSQKAIGGSGYDELRSLFQTKDGGIIAGGNSSSNKSPEKSQNISGANDYWVVKMDKQGKIQWEKTIGGNGNDNFKSVIQTNDGGYALIGESNSNTSVEKNEDSRGYTDYWLVKLDHKGNIEWDKTIGGNGTEFIDNIRQTSDGGYILAGSSDSDLSGEKTENSRGGSDYWVVKLCKKGKIEWQKTIGGFDYEYCSPVELTSDGGVIIGGFSQSHISGEKTENSRGGFDYWVVKLDKGGNFQWDKTIGGNDADLGRGIQQADDGGYVLAGFSISNISGDKSENSRGGFDYWVVKLDKEGNFEQDKTIGGSGDDNEIWCLEKTSDGGYIFGGNSDSYISGEKTADSRGGHDYWVIKLNRKGEIEWDKTIGGNGEETAFSMKEIGRNEYAVGGVSWSDISGDRTILSRGLADYWIVILNDKKRDGQQAESTENVYKKELVENSSNKNFSVYPNPARDLLNVQLNSKATLVLTDQSGKTILRQTFENNGVINISRLLPGLYYLKNNTTGATQKIIVTK